VFYINLPFGALALTGILLFVPETPHRPRPFDVFGFAMLSLAIGALQLMLDRGELKDWFSSSEIMIEAGIAALCFYLFVVQAFTAEHPFLDPHLFADRNFVTALVFIFLVGIVLLATLALLPPFLQNLAGFPVLTTGTVLAPRGIGTMMAMTIVGRLIGKVDQRLLILWGLSLTSTSLWQMTGFTPDVSTFTIVTTGMLQGFGLGFIFVPLSTLAFATLQPRLRTEAASLFSLIRNVGSSVGISMVTVVLTQSTQVNHAQLAEQANPYNPLYRAPWLPQGWSLTDPAGLAAVDQAVNMQAATIAYLNDFRLMMIVTLAAIPMLLFLRPPRRIPASPSGGAPGRPAAAPAPAASAAVD
jgi:DHA2 family multidrug resistance protein